MNRTKQLYSVFALFVVATMLLAACGNNPPPPPPTAEPTSEAAPTAAAQPQTLPTPSSPTQPSAPPAGQVPGMDLGGKVWQWTNTAYSDGRTIAVSNPASYTIEFSMADGKVTIKADCNNAQGDFMTDGQNLEIMMGGVTRAACPPGSLSDEYLKELSDVGSYQVQGETLSLTFAQNTGTMTFTAGQASAQPTAQPPAPPTAQPTPVGPALTLEGPTWKWVKTIYNNGTTSAAPDPSKYTLIFSQANGRFNFVADCNNGSGVYQLNGQNLTMQVQGMTRAACPPPSDDYIKQLGQVGSYKIEGNTLYLMLQYDSGTMTFTTGEVPPAASVATPTTSGSSAPATPSASSNLQHLTTGVWKWSESVDNSGKDWTSANPDNYTVQFAATGGIATIKADCNNASGAYTADDSNLTIVVGPTTLAACPPPTLGSEFLQQLGQVASYFFDGNNLILLWKLDSGSMKFSQ